MHGRRLIVLFFDLSSMQPEEAGRAMKAARDYVDRQLTPSDLVAVASFATDLRVEQDFTADRAALARTLDRLGGVNGQGFEAGTTGDAEGTADNGAAFTPDDTEFNMFNTDRRLDALQSLSDALAGIEQKKSVVYFSSGISQSGSDNQVELRRTIDRAVRANVSIYAADMRGLQAMVPGGEASQGSMRGVSPFSGAGVRSQFDALNASQDTLTTMAEDTGGRAFFDTNGFGDVFTARGRGHVGVLRAGLLEHQPGARRPVPQDRRAREAAGREARVPLGLLRRRATSRTRRATTASSSSRIS